MARLDGLDLGQNPRRRLTYYITHGLLQPRKVGLGRGHPSFAVFTPDALDRLRAIAALTRQGVAVRDMRRHLDGIGHRAPGSPVDPTDPGAVKEAWARRVAERFEGGTEDTRREVAQMLIEAVQRADVMNSLDGAGAALDTAFDAARRIARVLWAFNELFPIPGERRTRELLLAELADGFERVFGVLEDRRQQNYERKCKQAAERRARRGAQDGRGTNREPR